MKVTSRLFLLGVLLAGMTACTPTGGGSGAAGGTSAAVGQPRPGGLAPASGQTSAERAARSEYFRGPRGDEF